MSVIWGHALFHTDLYSSTEDRQNRIALMMTDSFLSILWQFATHCGPRKLVCPMPSGIMLGSPVLQERRLCMRSRPQDCHFTGSCHNVLFRLWITPVPLWSQGRHQTMLTALHQRLREVAGNLETEPAHHRNMRMLCTSVIGDPGADILHNDRAAGGGWCSVLTSWTPCKCQTRNIELWSRYSWKTTLPETLTLHRTWPKWALYMQDDQTLPQCVQKSGHDNQNLTSSDSDTASQFYV